MNISKLVQAMNDDELMQVAFAAELEIKARKQSGKEISTAEREMAQAGKRVDAIKMYRNRTGAGLQESIRLFDNSYGKDGVDIEINAAEREAWKEDHISAVRMYCTRTGARARESVAKFEEESATW